MSVVIKNRVKYYRNGDYFVVGNNKTDQADGITDASYTGEIVIEDIIKGKEVLEVSKNAFTLVFCNNISLS